MNTPAGAEPRKTEDLQGPPARHNQRLAALFLLGYLLFNYPLLQLFARDGTLFGVPVLYCYVFGAWGALIALIALVVEPPRRQ